MKKASILSVVLILFLSISCENSDLTPEQLVSQTQVLKDVRTWYESPLPEGVDPKKKAHGHNFIELWGNSKNNHLGMNYSILTVPILKPNNTKSTYYLLAFHTTEKVQGCVIQITREEGTTFNKMNSFSGQIKIRARNGNHLKTLKFLNGKKVITNASTFRTMEDEMMWGGTLPEVEIQGYSYEYDNPFLWLDLMDWDSYLTDNNYTADDNSWLYEDYGNDGTMDVGIPLDAIDYSIIDNLTNPCLQTVLGEVRNGNLTNNITKILNDTFGKNDKINVVFSEDPTLANNVYGETFLVKHEPENNEYDVEVLLNPNNLPSTSKEFIGDTFYHEIIHAYLNVNPSLSTELQQHETMAATYVSSMVTALRETYTTLSQQNAAAIVLSGFGDLQQNNPTLFNTLLTQNNLTANQVVSISTNYKNGTNGVYCSQ